LFPLNLASLGHLFQKESFEEVTLAFHFGLPSGNIFAENEK
jgi:hypothetical protein